MTAGGRVQGPFTSNPYKFDNHYFLETINYHQMPGNYPSNHLLFSDISQTFYGTRTFMQMYSYAQNNTLFFQARAPAARHADLTPHSPGCTAPCCHMPLHGCTSG